MALLPLRHRPSNHFRRQRTSLSHHRLPQTFLILPTNTSQAAARTFDFSAGDTAVFPDNAGHYIENTSANETLQWIEIYKSDRVVDISMTQWLALTPPEIVSATLKIPLDVAQGLRKEKQLIIA